MHSHLCPRNDSSRNDSFRERRREAYPFQPRKRRPRRIASECIARGFTLLWRRNVAITACSRHAERKRVSAALTFAGFRLKYGLHDVIVYFTRARTGATGSRYRRYRRPSSFIPPAAFRAIGASLKGRELFSTRFRPPRISDNGVCAKCTRLFLPLIRIFDALNETRDFRFVS